MVSEPLSENLEIPNGLDRVVEQLHQSWNDRLDFPPAKIPERYGRMGGSVALEMTCNIGGAKLGMCPFITFNNPLHFRREVERPGRWEDNEFSMLIDNVEIVNDPQGITEGSGALYG